MANTVVVKHLQEARAARTRVRRTWSGGWLQTLEWVAEEERSEDPQAAAVVEQHLASVRALPTAGPCLVLQPHAPGAISLALGATRGVRSGQVSCCLCRL